MGAEIMTAVFGSQRAIGSRVGAGWDRSQAAKIVSTAADAGFGFPDSGTDGYARGDCKTVGRGD